MRSRENSRCCWIRRLTRACEIDSEDSRKARAASRSPPHLKYDPGGDLDVPGKIVLLNRQLAEARIAEVRVGTRQDRRVGQVERLAAELQRVLLSQPERLFH